jgi:hypothetical protein
MGRQLVNDHQSTELCMTPIEMIVPLEIPRMAMPELSAEILRNSKKFFPATVLFSR